VAGSVWGFYWSWDPKERGVSSPGLRMAMIHQRLCWVARQAGSRACDAGFGLVMFTFLGVRHWLEGTILSRIPGGL
jgi:ABC-type transport system involved in cytochrome c biogenesis permease subunit